MINIKYFGEVLEKTGKPEEAINLTGQSPAELKAWLVSQYQLDMTGLKLAVNHQLVDWTSSQTFSETDEIAILSPFAGG